MIRYSATLSGYTDFLVCERNVRNLLGGSPARIFNAIASALWTWQGSVCSVRYLEWLSTDTYRGAAYIRTR